MEDVWREFSRQAKVVRLPEWPKCPMCSSELRRTPQGWYCADVCHLYFNVERGKVGAPLLNPTSVAAPPKSAWRPVVSAEETFENWIAKHGVTAEMYKGADERTQEDLKTAFYQRHLKEPDVALFPPQG